MINKNYAPSLNLIGEENCCGCGGCHNVCPTDAIKMQPDREGFLIPTLDADKCVNCSKCIDVCPVNTDSVNSTPLKSYGITNNDLNILLNSSSGGLFGLFARIFLEQYEDAYVVGVVYENDYKSVRHIISNDLNDVYRMQISKYVQSDKGKIYCRVKQMLQEQKYVLFTGLPCEIAALRCYLGKDFENLLLMDIMCKGPATPMVLRQYVDDMERKKHAKVTNINMRYKWAGLDNWIPQYIRIDFDRKNPYIKEFYNTVLGQSFRIMQRKSCANCKYTEYTHLSDITIGDFHGADKDAKYYNKLGTSALIINTSKGMGFFSVTKQFSLSYEEVSIDDIYKYNLKHYMNPYREKFSELLVKHGIKRAVMRTVSFKEKIKLVVPGDIFRRISRIIKKSR